MPKGPKGEKPKADVVGDAVLVAKIAMGEIEDKKAAPKSAAAELGSKGGKARAKSLSSSEDLSAFLCAGAFG